MYPSRTTLALIGPVVMSTTCEGPEVNIPSGRTPRSSNAFNTGPSIFECGQRVMITRFDSTAKIFCKYSDVSDLLPSSECEC